MREKVFLDFAIKKSFLAPLKPLVKKPEQYIKINQDTAFKRLEMILLDID